jgi:hypothetical protein
MPSGARVFTNVNLADRYRDAMPGGMCHEHESD